MLQQHQVGALFGLFVRAIGAARFVRAVAPVAALLAVASIPLPQAATSIDITAPSSGFVESLAIAQRAASDSVFSPERWRGLAADAAHRNALDEEGHASPAARIGDRWLQLRAQHATQNAEQASPRQVGDRLLHASASQALHVWTPATALEAFASLGQAVKPVASTGAEPRAPPVAASPSKDAGDPQPASANEIAQAAQATERDSGTAASGAVPASSAAAAPTKTPPETLSPLKLSTEQRNISRFVARRYRVSLDDVQRFVAHAYRAASEFRLDPHLVLAVMSIESSFNPNARSSAGAQGLMQVLTRVHLEKFAPFGGAHAALDPVANITVGSRILKEYLVREGSVEGALKSYVGAALLPHDFGYGRKVLAERARIAAAARNEAAPRTVTARADGDPTKIAMAATQRAGKAKVGTAAQARLEQRDAHAASERATTEAQGLKEAQTTEAQTTEAQLKEAQLKDVQTTDAPAKDVHTKEVQAQSATAREASPAVAEETAASPPAQPSEPRAASTSSLTPSGTLREL